ncbi:hypothetical protein JEM67_13380 [Serratia sp. PAMC26656]|uniref:hypothetical protein n=1 Tax=Serratia sp. PAMC26656 TaxID=2775909 RepID=UPI0018F5C308|nr:hypothetical protein [Serratia sp. PAMC26656]MBJ7893975.1 hypothetical protein [Serratia sp. PAMC26656]
MEKKNKNKQINVRLSDTQMQYLQQLVDSGKATTQSGALVYLINQYAILGGNNENGTK